MRNPDVPGILNLWLHSSCSVYEKQWSSPTMIGFYINPRYASILKNAESVNRTLLIEALTSGIDEHHQVDFVIASEQAGSYQEFQLKRFGMQGQQNTTENLITYLNSFKRQYAPIDATCLVALTEFDQINFPKLREEVERDSFPFIELLLVGVASEKFFVAGIFPEAGWSACHLSEVVR